MILLAMLLQAAPCPNPDGLPPRVAEARCAGVGLARIEKWREAAELFEGAAKALNDAKAVRLWAQAGNAWLAAGDAARAGAALDSALVWSAGLSAAEKGELQLDRARAAVAAGSWTQGGPCSTRRWRARPTSRSAGSCPPRWRDEWASPSAPRPTSPRR
jgi:hypothetical protein